MRNIGLLLKNYLICSIGSFRRKNTQVKTVVGFSTITVIFLICFALFTWCMCGMSRDLAAVNLQICVLALGFIISVFLSILFALQKVTGGKQANDIEMLLSMPFKKIEIMIAKALSRFCVNLLVVFMFFLPSFIGYLTCSPFSLPTFFGCIIVMLLIPLMSVGLSYIVDYLVTICFSNSKFGNITKAIFTLIVFSGVITIYEFFTFNITSPIIVNAANWIVTFNPAVMIPVIIGVLVVFILGNYLNALLLNRESRTARIKPVQITAKLTTPFKAMLKNESNRYFNSPTMIFNTIIGPLALIGITIWLAVDQNNALINILCFTFGVSLNTSYLIIAIMFGGLTTITYPAAFSISLEGKQLWILRSLPISAKTVLNAKVLFNILLVAPVSIICSLVLGNILQLPPLYFIALVLIPILTNILVSFAGVFINLCFPKLEFESEAAVIKQSMSSFIMMLCGIAMIALLIVAVIFIKLPIVITTIGIISFLVIANIAVITLTYTLGQRMFNNL